MSEPQFQTKQTKDGFFEYINGVWVPYTPNASDGSKPTEQSVGLTKKAGASVFRFKPDAPINLETQVREELDRFQNRLDEALVDLKTYQFMCEGTIPCVPTPKFEAYERETKKTIENALQGVLRKGELPPGLEEAIRNPSKHKAIERAARFIAELESEIRRTRYNLNEPIRLVGPAAQREVWKRGRHDGFVAIWRLLCGEEFQENNGHDRMKWFGPQVA